MDFIEFKMERAFLETIFICGVALLALLELYYLINFEADRKALQVQKKKRLFLFLLIAGIQVVPFVYIFSVDFGPTDYQWWRWLGIPATICFAFFVWLFIKGLIDLGKWWVPGQELKEDLELVQRGAYHYVRHPMYLALLGIAVCQVFMIQNWIAGPISLLMVTPFVIYQIRREERLLLRYFGDDYKEYCRKTGRLWPLEERMPLLLKILRELYRHLKLVGLFIWLQLGRLFRKEAAGSMDDSL